MLASAQRVAHVAPLAARATRSRREPTNAAGRIRKLCKRSFALPSAAKWRSIRYVSFPSGDPRIGTGKVDPPKEWQAVMKDHGRHHIIARPVLLAVWNGLAGAFIDTQLPEARTAVRQYLLLCGVPAANLDSLIDRIRAVQKTQQRAGHHHLPTLEAWEIDPIQRAVIWPAWNIVVGPVRADRDDDPEDRNRD